MGLFDFLKPKVPVIHSILPDIAVQEIVHGRLPILKTNKLFLKAGETCHYIDKALYEKQIVKNRYVRRSHGFSYSGIFFKDTRHHFGNGTTDVVDNVYYESFKGILYITNQRMIFQGERRTGFEINITDLTAIQPYGNCVELQCRKECYKIFVPDGNITHTVLKLI